MKKEDKLKQGCYSCWFGRKESVFKWLTSGSEKRNSKSSGSSAPFDGRDVSSIGLKKALGVYGLGSLAYDLKKGSD